MPDMDVPELLRVAALGPEQLYADQAASAIGWGGAVGAGMLLCCVFMHWPWYCVPVGLVSGAGIGACIGGNVSMHHRHVGHDRAISIIQAWAERVIREDLNNSGEVGDVVGDPQIVYYHNNTKGSRPMPDSDRADFRHFAEEVWNGVKPALRKWEGALLPSGRLMDRPLWEDYTGRLIKAGVARRSDDRPFSPLTKLATWDQAQDALRNLI